MVQMLHSRTQLTTIHKAWAHANINTNEQANQRAKMGHNHDHKATRAPHAHANSTHTTFKNIGGTLCRKCQTKPPLDTKGKHIFKNDIKRNLRLLANKIHELHKWLRNSNIDNELSNELWENLTITDKQKTYPIKYWTICGLRSQTNLLWCRSPPLENMPYLHLI